MANPVLTLSEIKENLISPLLAQYGLELTFADNNESIPGSFWGDSEAGLVGSQLFVRRDTPIHSLLHEACHYICMDEVRRSGLHTNAGGDYDEENAVCYLQILIAEKIQGMGSERMMQDMDEWGYTFRLGSARQWFEHDAEDAKQWLVHNAIIDVNLLPTSKLRQH